MQERPGYHRKKFKIYKFRTMYPGSEIMIKGKEVMKNDSRVTGIGRFLRRTKLDEMPQLLNILNMRPGLTGLAQVSGNIYLDLQERYCLDVYYVKHFSLLLDLKIVLRTIGVVLLGEERYKGRALVKKRER